MSATLTGQRRGDPAGAELARRRGSRPRPGSRIMLPAVLATAVVAFDQVTKAAITAWLGPDRSEHRYEVLGNLLALEYVENTGGVFGSLRGQSSLLVAVALVIVVGLVVFYRGVARPTPALTASLGLLVGGALGNVVDRLRLGHVIDYIAVGAWPKFNLADSAITLGVALLAWHVVVAGGTDEIAGTGQGARE